MKLLKLSLIIGSILLLVTSCNKETKEEKYTIIGEVTGFPNGTKLYLKNLSTEVFFDSVMVNNDQFKFEGKLTNTPEEIWIDTWLDKKHIYLPLIIKNEDIKIKGDIKDFPYNVKVTCSKTQKDNTLHFELCNRLNKYYKKKESIFKFHYSLSEEKQKEVKKELKEKIIKVDSLILVSNINFIKNNNDIYSSIISLGYVKDKMPRDTLQKIFNNYIPKIKNSKYAKIVKVFLKEKITKIGDKYHDFEGLNQKGEKVKFSDIKGENYTLLNFTSAYCKGCRLVEDDLAQVNKKYKDSLTIVSFSLDANKEDWLKSVKRRKITWNSVFDGKGSYSETYIKYGITHIPTFMLVNSKGIIIDRWSNSTSISLDNQISKYIVKNKDLQSKPKD